MLTFIRKNTFIRKYNVTYIGQVKPLSGRRESFKTRPHMESKWRKKKKRVAEFSKFSMPQWTNLKTIIQKLFRKIKLHFVKTMISSDTQNVCNTF